MENLTKRHEALLYRLLLNEVDRIKENAKEFDRELSVNEKQAIKDCSELWSAIYDQVYLNK